MSAAMQEIESMLADQRRVCGIEESEELATSLLSHTTHYIGCTVISSVTSVLFTVALLIM